MSRIDESRSFHPVASRRAAVVARLLTLIAAALASLAGAAMAQGPSSAGAITLGASLVAGVVALRVEGGILTLLLAGRRAAPRAKSESHVASTFLHVTRDIEGLADAREIARRAARAVTHLLSADTAVYFTLDETRQHVTAIAGYHVPPELRRPDFQIAIGDIPLALREASRKRQPLASSSVADDRRFDSPVIRSLPRQPRGMLCAPATRAGAVRGALIVCWWRERHQPTDHEMRVATAVATHVAIALDASSAAWAKARTVPVLAPNRTLFIVARHNEHLFRSLTRTFAGDETVEVLLDRRIAQRRRERIEAVEERRRRDRRRLTDIDRQLRRRGWAVVTVKPFPS